MPDPTTPIWLLDVDGVINVGRPGWSAAPHRATVNANDVDWPLRWAPRLIERIREIHEGGHAEVVWSTTWCPFADRLERLWGLPELRRAWDEFKHGFYAVEAKRDAAREALASGRRVVWTDDDAFPSSGWPERELLAGGQALLIKPIGKYGLQPADLDTISDFLAGAPGPERVVTTVRARRPRRRRPGVVPA